MKKVNLVYLIALFFCAVNFTTILKAQTFTVNPTKVNVKEGQNFQITYTLAGGNFDDVQGADLNNFYIISGPNRSQSFEFINGRTSRTSTLQYVLKPKKPGRFVIPPFTAVVNKKAFRSESVTVNVAKGSRNSATVPQRPPRPNARSNNKTSGLGIPSNTPNKNIRDIFLGIVVDTTGLYQGQQLTAIYRLYTAVDVTNYNITDAPEFTGFWVQDITPQGRKNPKDVVIDSMVYRTYDLKEYALFPQRTGTLELAAMKIDVTARIRRNSNQSVFQRYRNKQVKLTSDAVAVTVYPVPDEGKPIDFQGAVGQFNIRGNLNKRQVKMNEAVDMVITITGYGNIKLLNPPAVVFPETIDSFDPVIGEKVYNKNKMVGGNKSFTYTLIPNKKGRQEIPSITYSFFDPKTKKYKTLKTAKTAIMVTEGDEVASEEFLEEETGLLPIKKNTHLYKKGKGFFVSPIFWSLFGLPFFLLPIFTIAYRKREQELGDVISQKRKLANQVAIQRLAVAEKHLQANDKRSFYDEVIHAIWGYLSDKLNLPVSALAKENIASVLTQRNAGEQTIKKLVDTIAYCEMALFAPVADADNLKGTYEDTITLLADLEEEI